MSRLSRLGKLGMLLVLLFAGLVAANCSSTTRNQGASGGAGGTNGGSVTGAAGMAGASGESCTPEEVACEELVPVVCSEAGTWRAARAACAATCLEGQCVACSEGDRQCRDGAVQVCEDGSWKTDELCPVTCEDGACVTSCTADRLQCSGQKQLQRCDGTEYVLEEECDYVCSNRQCTGECAPDARRCNPEAPGESQSCSAEGEWGESLPCPDDSFCVNGDCKPCEPDSKRCADTGPQVCSEHGEWIPLGACASSTPACHEGECVACAPGDKRCSGNVLEVCNDQASGWDLAEACGGETPACIDSLKACGKCSAEQLQCDDNVVQECNEAGTWSDLTTCSDALPQCHQGSCVACDPATGQRRCLDSDTAQQCDSHGGWGATTECGGDTPLCREDLNYTCGCDEGDRRCAQNTPEVCTGGAWVPQAACSGSTPLCLPASGSCVACQPGTETCQAGVAHECDSQGSWDSLDACFGETVNCGGCDLGEDCDGASDCNSGFCVNSSCAECSPTSQSCSGSVPRTCSSAGSWQDGTPCSAPTNGNPTCSGGTCGFSCLSGFKKCQNRCISNAACCSNSDCPSNATCSNDACVCNPGFTGPSCVPIFEPIARVEGQNGDCQAHAISGDGSVIVGYCLDSAKPSIAFRWQSGAVTPLADNGEGSAALGISTNGTVVVGSSNNRPARWVNGVRTIHRTLVQDASFGSGRIFDVSSNGNILVGYTSDSQGPNWVRWDLSGGANPDPALIYTALGSQTVTGMADSGALMSGTVPSTNPRAIYWTPTDGIKTVTYSEAISYGHGMSSNGAIMVGESLASGSSGSGRAVYWPISMGGIVGLGVDGIANRANSNGTVIAGLGTIGGVANTAFLWRGGTAVGLRSALSAAGATIQGWTITQITGLSSDGALLTGYGLNASGEVQGWRATLTGTGIVGF